MADLKELTAEELLRHTGIGLYDADGRARQQEWWAEIRRRLERLERVEQALAEYQGTQYKLEQAEERLEKVEAVIKRALLHHDTNNRYDYLGCQCSTCDILRAALKPQGGEEKRGAL